MNPRELPLDKQTDFFVRVTAEVQVHVPPKPSHSNGLCTGQRRAVDKAQGYFENILYDASHQLSDKGINVFVRNLPGVGPDVQISADPFDIDWLEPVERLFDSMYFDGRGDYSARDSAILLARLRDCFSTLSGLQQGAEDENGKFTRRLENVARDIAMALTGKEIQFVERTDGP